MIFRAAELAMWAYAIGFAMTFTGLAIWSLIVEGFQDDFYKANNLFMRDLKKAALWPWFLWRPW